MSNVTKAEIKNVLDQVSSITPSGYLKANIAIGLVAANIENVTNMRLKKYDLHHSSYTMLSLLVENGGSLHITDITKKLYLSRQAIALMTRNLEKRKLVTRDGIKDDRRKLKVSITKAGLELVRTLGVSEARKQTHNVLVSLMTEDEAIHLANTLNAISNRFRRLKVK
jgi:DNA-binding MarR family transcriptional regulator